MDREFERQRTHCIKNVDFTICEIAKRSKLSDQVLIRTVDHSSYRSFGDREFKMERTQYNNNPDFAMCDITIQLWPLKQVHIWTVGSTLCRSFTNRNMERQKKQCRICNMRNRESTLCIRVWSQPLITGRERVSPDKLHIIVSGIRICK
jgi:hypothetical protein